MDFLICTFFISRIPSKSHFKTKKNHGFSIRCFAKPLYFIEIHSQKSISLKTHHYSTQVNWTGNKGEGTKSYTSYERSHSITAQSKPEILASSDPAFRGDPSKYNPEELLIASVSSCHMLWFLHLCSVQGVVVSEYSDQASGTMIEEFDGSGKFSEIVLNPKIVLQNEEHRAILPAIHELAHAKCFIANTLNCNVIIK